MEIDKYLEQRCKHYKTTLSSCTCLGFQYRQKCKHNTYLNDKEKYMIDTIKIKDGVNCIEAIEKYGETIIDGMIHRGEIYENKDMLFNFT